MLPIAHRAPASRDEAERLVTAGARMIEIDVQLRGDAVVVSHFLPLRGARAGLPVQRDNWRLRRAPGRDPLLREVLARVPAGCAVLLDPKHHPGVVADELRAAVLAELDDAGADPARFTVSTSDPQLLAGYRAAGLTTWRSIGDPAGLRTVLGGSVGADGVSVRHTLLDAETAAGLRRQTGIIVAWTVNSVARAHRLAQLGVGGITTDRPAVLVAVSRARQLGEDDARQ